MMRIVNAICWPLLCIKVLVAAGVAIIASALRRGFDFAKSNMLEIVSTMFMVICVLFLGGWLYNSFKKGDCDLPVLLQGMTALCGAGVLAAVKYITDSVKNSQSGTMPYEKRSE